MRLSSTSFLEGFYYKPRIDKEILERHAEGLICLSGCASAEFSDLHPPRQDGRGRAALRLVPGGLRAGELLRRDPGQRHPDPARLRRRGARHRAADGPAAGRHQRRPLPDPGGRRRPRHPALHQHGQDASTTRTGCGSRTTSSTSAAPRRCTRRCPATRRPWPPRPGSPTLVEDHYKSLEPRQAPVPLLPAPRPARRPRTTSASCASRASRDRYGADPPPAARDRLEHELGIINRMGFASYFLIVWDFVRFAREQRHPHSAPRLGLRGAGQLPAVPQPRRPADVRPAVRAVPRPEPLRGARHRHRPLPGPARTRSSSTSASKYGAGQRRADRHLRHDGGQGRAARTSAGP